MERLPEFCTGMRSLWIILLLLRVPPSCCKKTEDDEETSENRDPSRGPQLAKPTPRLLRGAFQENKTETSAPEYYSQEYYSSSLEPEFFPPAGNRSTTTSRKPSPTKKQSDDDYSSLNTYEDELTDDAWALMPNAKELREEEQRIKDEWWGQWWQAQREHTMGVYYYGKEKEIPWFFIMCYQLGSTFFNAKSNLREYYKIRFAYYNNKEFEIGYVVHEIVYKYTVLLELFHNVQLRYYNQSKFTNLAPNTYMVYMYTVIVEQSQQIMHLCNVLHEVEKKYGDLDKLQNNKDAAKYAELGYHVQQEMLNLAYMEEQKEKKRLVALKRKQRKERQAMKKSGIFSSTRRTRRPQTQGHFPRHYGWSVEYW